jgi:hypothetical protein
LGVQFQQESGGPVQTGESDADGTVRIEEGHVGTVWSWHRAPTWLLVPRNHCSEVLFPGTSVFLLSRGCQGDFQEHIVRDLAGPEALSTASGLFFALKPFLSIPQSSVRSKLTSWLSWPFTNTISAKVLQRC